jgi:thiamine-phosphate pyrophosphorylase
MIDAPIFNHPDSVAICRILDASINRAGESLRVIEDYLRLGLDDAPLCRRCKELRHAFYSLVGMIPTTALLAARDTPRDVGTHISTPSESERTDPASVVAANFSRLSQSLRSLEEYGKIVMPEFAARCEALRYQTYALRRELSNCEVSNEQLAHARLYVLIDGRESETACLRLAESLVSAGVHVLQLRDKSLNDRELLARARMLRTVTRGSGTLLIVNDRPDLAVLADADGVHVGQEELPVRETRAIVGVRRIIGVSTHNLQQARQAVRDGANYLGCGPTFQSATKVFAEFPGIDFLRQVAAEIHLPTFAIGGITTTNLEQVLQAGMARVAVGAALVEAADPAKTAAQFLAMLPPPAAA